MVHCRVMYEGQEVDVSIQNDDMTIEMALIEARNQLETPKGGNEIPSVSLWTVRRERGDKELDLDGFVKDLVEDGDVLMIEAHVESRPKFLMRSELTMSTTKLRPARPRSSIMKTLQLDRQLSKKQRKEPTVEIETLPPGLPGCRLGIFVVTPLKFENAPHASRLRLSRLSVSVRLVPYEDIETTAIAIGPNFSWSSQLRFSHLDPTRNGLIIQLGIYDEPLLGSRALIGRAYFVLEDALDAPGNPLHRWLRVDPVVDGVTTSILVSDSRISVSVCFHPKVSKGPTVHALLHSAAYSQTTATPSDHATSTTKRELRVRLRKLLPKLWWKNEIRAVDAATMRSPQSLRRIKGGFSFALRGFHFCSDHCTKLDGHSTVSLPDFSPILVVHFEDFEDEIRLSPGDCNMLNYTHEWPVYSSYSKVEVDIYRRASLRTRSAVRRIMYDGSSAVKVGSIAISCFDVQEEIAAGWTLDDLEPVYGPGKRPPDNGYRWYPVMMDNEDIGLAHIAAYFSEDITALVDDEENPDVTFVPPDERNFDAAIVQRNFERLDDLYLTLQEIKGYSDDILDLKYPLRSTVVWTTINSFFFVLSAEHLPLLLMVFILATLSITCAAFLRGNTHKKWIEYNPGASRLKIYRPIATLRFAVIRASHLSAVVGYDGHPDTFVRVFYEPNYKKIPVQQVAVTECARRTPNPEWSIPQHESVRDDFLRRNNNRLRDMIRHLSPHAQDAVLHDVVEPWPRKNGGSDLNAFRLSMLQPAKIDEATGGEVLIEWRNSPGTIRFDVLQDCNSESNPILGRARVPIRSLVTNELIGGTQNEFELTLPLTMPPRHAQNRPNDDQLDSMATITIRLQMILPHPGDRITLRDNLASEALYEALEMEVEQELSWVAKYHKAKDVARNFQHTLEMVCSTLERFKNLFLWVHPAKTLLVCVLALVGCVCFYFIPMRYFVLYSTTKAFTRKFHKAEDRDLTRFQNLLASIPSDLDMKRIYRWRNQEHLIAKEFSEAHAQLQAQWSGLVLRQRYAWIGSWQERYCAIREGRLEFWNSIADAKAGFPPRQSYPISCAVDSCTKAELGDIPRDRYPLVVFDVSPSLLAISPSGSRRILCFKSEDAFLKFSNAVRSSGEPIGVQDSLSPTRKPRA